MNWDDHYGICHSESLAFVFRRWLEDANREQRRRRDRPVVPLGSSAVVAPPVGGRGVEAGASPWLTWSPSSERG
jgi:hypothetical protein